VDLEIETDGSHMLLIYLLNKFFIDRMYFLS